MGVYNYYSNGSLIFVVEDATILGADAKFAEALGKHPVKLSHIAVVFKLQPPGEKYSHTIKEPPVKSHFYKDLQDLLV